MCGGFASVQILRVCASKSLRNRCASFYELLVLFYKVFIFIKYARVIAEYGKRSRLLYVIILDSYFLKKVL